MYSPEAMDHFLKPRNAGTVADADGRGHATNEACGDTAVITVKTTDGVVAQARFSSEACAGGIACCSAITQWATQRPVKEVLAVDADTLSAILGGLPEAKLGCAQMAVTALKRAVEQGS